MNLTARWTSQSWFQTNCKFPLSALSQEAPALRLLRPTHEENSHGGVQVATAVRRGLAHGHLLGDGEHGEPAHRLRPAARQDAEAGLPGIPQHPRRALLRRQHGIAERSLHCEYSTVYARSGV